MFKERFRLMDAAGEGGAAGGGAGGGAGAGGGGEGGKGGAGGPGAGQGDASALAAAAAAAAAAAGKGGQGDGKGAGAGAANPHEWMPEKYRVFAPDGDKAFKLEDSARKLADGHVALEKRLGTGEIRPESVDGYKFDEGTLPKGIDQATFMKSEAGAQFVKDAHAAGYNNAQLNVAIKSAYAMATRLAGQVSQMTSDKAVAEMKATWGTEFDTKMGAAVKGAQGMAKLAGFTFDEIEKAGLGNNPTFMKLAAAVSSQFGEDVIPNPALVGATAETIETMMASPAYLDQKHPDNKRVSATVKAWYEKKFGTAPVA